MVELGFVPGGCSSWLGKHRLLLHPSVRAVSRGVRDTKARGGPGVTPGKPLERGGARAESGPVSVSEERWGRSQERTALGRGLGHPEASRGRHAGPASARSSVLTGHRSPRRALLWATCFLLWVAQGCQALCKECGWGMHTRDACLPKDGCGCLWRMD